MCQHLRHSGTADGKYAAFVKFVYRRIVSGEGVECFHSQPNYVFRMGWTVQVFIIVLAIG